MTKNSAIILNNCHVKQSRNSPTDVEIILTHHSKIESSPKTFASPKKTTFSQPKTITLADLPYISAAQTISTPAKITKATKIIYHQTKKKTRLNNCQPYK